MAIKLPWHAEALDLDTDLYRQMTEIFALRELVARLDNTSLDCPVGYPETKPAACLQKRSSSGTRSTRKAKKQVDRPGR